MKKLILPLLMIGVLLRSSHLHACTCAIRDFSFHEIGVKKVPLNPIFHYEPARETPVVGSRKPREIKPDVLQELQEKRRQEIRSIWKKINQYEMAILPVNERNPESDEDETYGRKVSLKMYTRITIEHMRNDEPLMVITPAHPLQPGKKYELLFRTNKDEMWLVLDEFTTLTAEDQKPPKFSRPVIVKWLKKINDCYDPEGPFLQVETEGVTDDVAEGLYWFDLWFADEHGGLDLDRPADLGLPSPYGSFVIGHGYCLQPVYDFHEKLDKFKFGIRATDQSGHSSAIQIIEAPYPNPEAETKQNPVVASGE